MSFLDEIYQTYLTFNHWLTTFAPQPGALAPARMAELSAYAFFVLLFGQLEDYINQEYAEYVGPWEKVAFQHRVNLVFEEQSARADIVMDYYRIRCEVAHGHAEPGHFDNQVNVPVAYEDILKILSY